MLTLVSKDSVKISDHFDVLCVLIACMVLEIINQMSKNQKSSLIVWNTVPPLVASLPGLRTLLHLYPFAKFYHTCIMCIEVTMWGRKGCSLIPRPDPGTRLEATTTPVPRLLRYPKLVGKGQKIFQS